MAEFEAQLSAAVDDDLAFLQQQPAAASSSSSSNAKKRRRRAPKEKPWSMLTWEEKLAAEEKEQRRIEVEILTEAPKIKRDDRGRPIGSLADYRPRTPHHTTLDIISNQQVVLPVYNYSMAGSLPNNNSAIGAFMNSSYFNAAAFSGGAPLAGADEFRGLDDEELGALGGSETDGGSLENIMGVGGSSSGASASGYASRCSSSSSSSSARPRADTLDSSGGGSYGAHDPLALSDEAMLAGASTQELLGVIRSLRAEAARLRDRADAAEAELRLVRAGGAQQQQQVQHRHSGGGSGSSSGAGHGHRRSSRGAAGLPVEGVRDGDSARRRKRRRGSDGAGTALDASATGGAAAGGGSVEASGGHHTQDLGLGWGEPFVLAEDALPPLSSSSAAMVTAAT